MCNTYVQHVGFTTSPFAIVIWKKPEQAMQLACKTICYDEDEVQNALARQNQGCFKQLTPTVHYIGEAELSQKVS